MKDEAVFRQVIQAIGSASHPLLISHVRPDGDAVGALLGFGLALQGAGKAVQMVLADGVPASFRFLSGSEIIMKSQQDAYDLVCTLDCSDISRAGDVLPAGTIPDVNIDHHVTNLNYARINLVDAHAVATAEIVSHLITLMGISLSPAVASAMLTGLITDTLGFRTSNMKPEVLRLAAMLMEAGANLPEIYRHSLSSHTFEALRFWGTGLSNLQRDGNLVWTILPQISRHAAGYPGRDDADLINLLTTIEPSDIVLIFVEQPDGSVKVSWRAGMGLDVSKVALRFGGGGHPSAAGALIHGKLEEVQAAVLIATQALLDGKT